MRTLLLILLFFVALPASAEIYRWRDSKGVSHYSNNLDDVPLRYRAKVKAMNYEQVQKGGTTPQAVSPVPAPVAGTASQAAAPPVGQTVTAPPAGKAPTATDGGQMKSRNRGFRHPPRRQDDE